MQRIDGATKVNIPLYGSYKRRTKSRFWEDVCFITELRNQCQRAIRHRGLLDKVEIVGVCARFITLNSSA